jgi:hypothetical protein
MAKPKPAGKAHSRATARAFREGLCAYLAALGRAGGKVKSKAKLAQLRAAAKRPRPSRRKFAP